MYKNISNHTRNMHTDIYPSIDILYLHISYKKLSGNMDPTYVLIHIYPPFLVLCMINYIYVHYYYVLDILG